MTDANKPKRILDIYFSKPPWTKCKVSGGRFYGDYWCDEYEYEDMDNYQITWMEKEMRLFFPKKEYGIKSFSKEDGKAAEKFYQDLKLRQKRIEENFSFARNLRYLKNALKVACVMAVIAGVTAMCHNSIQQKKQRTEHQKTK